MMSKLGPEFEPFLRSLEKPPPVSIRFNPRKLKNYHGEQVPWARNGRYLSERPIFTLDPLLHAGAYYVQEASSMLLEQAVMHTMDLDQPLTVLDLCAAPGGKSTHLLSLLSADSLLISNEVIRSRSSILSENLQKWGHDNVVVTHSDPSDFQRLPGLFDMILVDAPCSGEGLFRKDPEAMSEWSPDNIELCSLRQRRIVNNIWPALKPGGVMIYSTCTYNEKENIDNLKQMAVERDIAFLRIPVPPAWGITVVEDGGAVGYQCFPHHLKGEGFFLSVLQKGDSGILSKYKTKDVFKCPTKSQREDFSRWILSPDAQYYFIHQNTIRMFPVGKKMEVLLALHYLKVIGIGTSIAEIMKNKLVPDHALALSIKLNKVNTTRIPVTRDQALAYLRKNQLELPSSRLGFALIEFEGMGLGWVNVIQNRFNNLYPSSWRIRMEGNQ